MLPLSKDDLIEFTRFPSIILVKVDETGNVQAINPEVRKILGYPPEKVMGERLTPSSPRTSSARSPSIPRSSR